MNFVTIIVIAYLVVINIVSFIMFGVDKGSARNRAQRIPEKRLFLFAILGGSVGAIAGMYCFRHKTRHWYFKIGMPVILVLHLVAASYFGLLPTSSNELVSQVEVVSTPAPTEQVIDFETEEPIDEGNNESTSLPDGIIPEYDGEDTVLINYGDPSFTKKEKKTIEGESYSELDSLGRCGVAVARLHRDMMPEDERGSIGHIRPSGWHTIKYPDLIKDRYLYNRCHLIAFALTGQTSNELNLITGTRYLNAELMLPYEMEVMHYLEDTDNHVLYRVTPRFKGKELVARGVEMEAWSVEDKGKSLSFHVFVFNVQPGIEIDYLTGESKREEM